MSDRELLEARIPKELKERVDIDSRNNQDVVRDALRKEFGCQSKAALESEKQSKQKQAEALKDTIDAKQEQYFRLLEEVRSLESQIEKIESEDGKYGKKLDALLDERESGEGPLIIPSVCNKVANRFGKTAEQVVEDCKKRAVEQDRDLRVADF